MINGTHINILQYDARYTLTYCNTMHGTHINILQYDARYTQHKINDICFA